MEQTPNAVIYAEKTYIHDGIVVGPFRYEGSTPASSGYEWPMVLLARVSPEGLFIGIEADDEDQWVEALARFDELRGETEPVPGPVSESESASEGSHCPTVSPSRCRRRYRYRYRHRCRWCPPPAPRRQW